MDPMSEERNTLRYSLLPSLLNIYKYNKARGNKDISIYEIGATFYKKDEEYHEEEKLAILMTGDYFLDIQNTKVDFYIIKGVLEELLESLGYKNRYSLRTDNFVNSDLHPGQSAAIILNNVEIGKIGRVHPRVCSDNVYVMEINLDTLRQFRTKGMQYKEVTKYPSISKDLAFVVKKDISAESIMNVIKKSGGKLLTNIRIFDVYEGENVGQDEKSIAFSLTFQDANRTLNDEEIMIIFNRIIEEVEKKLNAKVRCQ